MEAYLVFFSTAYVSKMEGSLEQSCSLQVMDNEAFFFFFAFGEGGSNMDMVSSAGGE